LIPIYDVGSVLRRSLLRKPHRPHGEPFSHAAGDPGRQPRRAAIALARRRSLPTWTELARPSLIPDAVDRDLASVGPDEPNGKPVAVHWFNDAKRRDRTALPGHVILPEALTGVKAPIVVLLGRRFP
jgi:hypothetical protein